MLVATTEKLAKMGSARAPAVAPVRRAQAPPGGGAALQGAHRGAAPAKVALRNAEEDAHEISSTSRGVGEKGSTTEKGAARRGKLTTLKLTVVVAGGSSGPAGASANDKSRVGAAQLGEVGVETRR